MALTPNSRLVHRRGGQPGGAQTQRQPGGGQRHPLAHDQPAHGGRLRAQGHADADLLRAPADRIGHHAVDAQRRQDQRGGGEQVQQQQVEARLPDGVGDHPVHGGHLGHRQVGIQGPHLALDRGGQRGAGLGGRSHDQRQVARGVRVLEVGQVDLGPGRGGPVLLPGIADDAHHLARVGAADRSPGSACPAGPRPGQTRRLNAWLMITTAGAPGPSWAVRSRPAGDRHLHGRQVARVDQRARPRSAPRRAAASGRPRWSPACPTRRRPGAGG